jgi:hypothetical protein
MADPSKYLSILNLATALALVGGAVWYRATRKALGLFALSGFCAIMALLPRGPTIGILATLTALGFLLVGGVLAMQAKPPKKH